MSKILTQSKNFIHKKFTKNFTNKLMDFRELRNKLKEPASPDRRRAVLLSTGSFCPVHKSHLRNIEIAAKFLSESHQIDTLVAYISPSCDLYVKHKLGKECIPFNDRYEMVRLACDVHNSDDKNSVKIIIDPWEGNQPYFVPFPSVLERFQDEIQNNFPSENLIVLYVAGADQFNRCKLYRSSCYVGISRIGYQIKGDSCIERNIYICKDEKYEKYFSDISSTSIREARQKGIEINNLTYEPVVEYLRDVVHWF